MRGHDTEGMSPDQDVIKYVNLGATEPTVPDIEGRDVGIPVEHTLAGLTLEDVLELIRKVTPYARIVGSRIVVEVPE